MLLRSEARTDRILIFRLGRRVNVVGIGGPAEERAPPVAIAVAGNGRFPPGIVGAPVAGYGGGADAGGVDREDIGRHDCCVD